MSSYDILISTSIYSWLIKQIHHLPWSLGCTTVQSTPLNRPQNTNHLLISPCCTVHSHMGVVPDTSDGANTKQPPSTLSKKPGVSTLLSPRFVLPQVDADLFFIPVKSHGMSHPFLSFIHSFFRQRNFSFPINRFGREPESFVACIYSSVGGYRMVSPEPEFHAFLFTE